jgi:hypothetical protein
MIVFTHEGNAADGDTFLAYVKMEESSHLTSIVMLQGNLFKAPDPAHFAIKLNLLLWGQSSIDGHFSVFDLGGDGFSHEKVVILARKLVRARRRMLTKADGYLLYFEKFRNGLV